MRNHSRIALACLILGAAPAVARGQALPAALLAPDSSASVTSVMLVEIPPPLVWPPVAAMQAVAQDPACRSQEQGPSFIMHVGFGLLAGLLIGGGIGLYGDLNCRDCMFPVTPYTAAIGAGLGGLVGLTIWNLRRDP